MASYFWARPYDIKIGIIIPSIVVDKIHLTNKVQMKLPSNSLILTILTLCVARGGPLETLCYANWWTNEHDSSGGCRVFLVD